MRKHVLCAVVGLSLGVAPLSSMAAPPEEWSDDGCSPSLVAKVVDVTLARPLSLPFSIVGSALYTGLSPLLYLTGTEQPTDDYMVIAPWRYTARRQVGCFSTYEDGLGLTGR